MTLNNSFFTRFKEATQYECLNETNEEKKNGGENTFYRKIKKLHPVYNNACQAEWHWESLGPHLQQLVEHKINVTDKPLHYPIPRDRFFVIASDSWL